MVKINGRQIVILRFQNDDAVIAFPCRRLDEIHQKASDALAAAFGKHQKLRHAQAVVPLFGRKFHVSEYRSVLVTRGKCLRILPVILKQRVGVFFGARRIVAFTRECIAHAVL